MFYALDDYFIHLIDESDDEIASSKSEPCIEREKINPISVIRSLSFEDRLIIDKHYKMIMKGYEEKENISRLFIEEEYNCEQVLLVSSNESIERYKIEECFESVMRLFKEIKSLIDDESHHREKLISQSEVSFTETKTSFSKNRSILVEKMKLKKKKKNKKEKELQKKQREREKDEEEDQILEKLKNVIKPKEEKYDFRAEDYEEEEIYSIEALENILVEKRTNTSIEYVINLAYKYDLEPEPFFIEPYIPGDEKSCERFSKDFVTWIVNCQLSINYMSKISDIYKMLMRFSLLTMINLTVYNMIKERNEFVFNLLKIFIKNSLIFFDLEDILKILYNRADGDSIKWLIDNGYRDRSVEKYFNLIKKSSKFNEMRKTLLSRKVYTLRKLAYNGDIIHTPYFVLEPVGLKYTFHNVKYKKLAFEEKDDDSDSNCCEKFFFDEADEPQL